MVCRTRHDDAEMCRVARDTRGEWYAGRGEGRGAWLCSPSCAREVRSSHLARALRATLGTEDAAKVRELAASKWP